MFEIICTCSSKKCCGLIIGHNWGSEHDPDTPGCAPGVEKGGKYLMYPYSVSGYEHNNQVSTQYSIRFNNLILNRWVYTTFDYVLFLIDFFFL